MDIFPLFASNLFCTIVDERVDQLKQLAEKQIYYQPKINDWSLNSPDLIPFVFSSEDKYILKDQPRIEKILMKHVNKIMDEVFHYTNDFKLTTSWFTKIDYGGMSHAHNHKNSFYSGLLYFDEYDNDCGNIEFQNPVLNYSDFFIDTKSYNIQNSNVWNIKPCKGLLVLFPSYLYHRITLHQSLITRYSLAFNIIPERPYGIGDSSINI